MIVQTNIKKTFLLFAWFSCAELALAGEDCAAIVNDNDRLACYDRIAAGDQEQSPIEIRRDLEELVEDNAFALTPHRPNYVLPFSHNSSADFSQYGRFDDPFKETEFKFQLSLKYPLLDELLWDSSIHVGYTQQSYWQLYAEESASAPFRETNHEPELIWAIPTEFDLSGIAVKQISFALNHQSNGRTEPLSRSWNRLVNQYVFEKEKLTFSFTWWWRIEEDREDDDNPNIENYMGRFAIGGLYKLKEHTLGVSVKNNGHKENRSGIQADWMFPLASKLSGYVQLYSGYGENLIDQENYNNRISVGLALSNWL